MLIAFDQYSISNLGTEAFVEGDKPENSENTGGGGGGGE